jgi:hypothetical protein
VKELQEMVESLTQENVRLADMAGTSPAQLAGTSPAQLAGTSPAQLAATPAQLAAAPAQPAATLRQTEHRLREKNLLVAALLSAAAAGGPLSLSGLLTAVKEVEAAGPPADIDLEAACSLLGRKHLSDEQVWATTGTSTSVFHQM